MQTVASIQYLRALSALAVLVFHVMDRRGGGFFIGNAGVDVFFLISGFIMWMVTCTRETSFKAFMVARLVRIVPAYWIVTLALVTAGLMAPDVFHQFRTSFGHILLSLLFVPHLNPAGEAYPVLIPGWTLTFEMFFYVAFGLCLWLAARARLWAVTGLLLALVATGVAVQFGSVALRVYTNPLLLEFLAGLWLGAAWTRRALPGRAWGLGLILLGVLAYVAVVAIPLRAPPGAGNFWRVMLWGGPGVLIVGGALAVEAHGGVPRIRSLLLVGNASYAIYLLHGALITLCFKLLPGAPVAILLPVCIAAGVGVGIGFHLWLELPVAGLLRRSRQAAPPAGAPVQGGVALPL
jgi:exopolysaccharide production protein ExoZ